MTTTNDSEPQATRRIRPWLAGLLTFLGWGVGLYYARKTRAAVKMAIGQVIVGVLVGGTLVAYLALNGPVNFPIADPINFSAVDAISLASSAVVAVGVWGFLAKSNTTVERAGPTRWWGYLGIWLLPIIGAMFLALLFRSFLFQPFHVPSGAMTPTLQVGDYFAVQKSSYGYSRFSVALFGGALREGRILAQLPERGDVVVFKNRRDRNKDYVKRLIGLPGDEIQMTSGVLHINGEPVKKEFIEIRENTCGGGGDALTYRETLDNGVSYLVLECSGDDGGLDNVGPYLVPDGHYFMLGDNRDQSQDSRVIAAVGFIPYDDLVGKVALNTKNGRVN